jgi:hypothetical protein
MRVLAIGNLLLNAMRWADPDVILTRFPGDTSTDHNVTGSLAGRLLLSLPGKNVPADEPPLRKRPSLFYWDTPAGLQNGVECAEGFRACRQHGYMPDFSKLPLRQ